FPGVERLDAEQGTACDLCHRLPGRRGACGPGRIPNSAQPSVSSAWLARRACDPGRMNAASYASPAPCGKLRVEPAEQQLPVRENIIRKRQSSETGVASCRVVGTRRCATHR